MRRRGTTEQRIENRKGDKMEELLRPSIVVLKGPMGGLANSAHSAGLHHIKRTDQSPARLAEGWGIESQLTENKQHN